MELSGWLERNKTPRSTFARAVGVSPGRITQICEGELPSLELAERIARETAGAVTPNDFLGLVPSQQWINNLMSDTQQRIATAVEAFARGEIVVVTDDDDRENEGDLIIAAVHTTPEKMAFIIRHTCGIVCAPVTGEIARRLHLAPMVADSDAIHGTAFTISVDYRHGTTTGISADDRTATIRGLANGNSGRADFVRPGHIFPLIAKDGGVLMRSGHTEAAIDLCRFASIEPVEIFGPRCQAEAERVGVPDVTKLTILGDGAEWIWNLASEHFAGAEQTLDVYHATEYLADLARAGFGGDTKAVKEWTRRAQLALVADGWAGVCEFVHQNTAEVTDRSALEAAYPRVANYLSGHQDRMMYAARLRRGASIGSGMIEGTIKQLVGRRIKQTGARWKTDHIGPMVELISLGHTTNWEAYWSAA